MSGLDVEVVFKELLIASKFALVGIAATVVHVGIVWILIAKAGLVPMLSNVLAFLSAFIVSFSGNWLWTFSKASHPLRALKRFFTVAGAGFLLNSGFLLLILEFEWLQPQYAAVVSASLVPFFSYIVSRLWAFKPIIKE